MVELFENSGDPDQTPRFVASDLSLYCLPTKGVSRFKGSPDYNVLKFRPQNLPKDLVLPDGK